MCRSPSSEPLMVDEPAAAPQRWLRSLAPWPGRESRDRKERAPNWFVMSPEGRFRPDEGASYGQSDHKARAPVRDAIGLTQTCQPELALVRSRYDRERGPRYCCVDGLLPADPRPSAVPHRIRTGSRDRRADHMGHEEMPKGNPAAPRVLEPGHSYRPFPAPRNP